MELPALIAVLVDAMLAHCPQYDRASVTVALESVFAGHPTLLGGNSISMLFGQNNDFTNATVTIGDVHAGNQVQVTLPQPIDPLPAALAALASIPLTDVPAPRSDLPQASRLPFESSPHFVGRETELKALAQAIGTTQPAVVMPAVATGLGGIGKTSLVTEFAYRYGVYFHGGVFWLNCADADQVASQIAACAVDLGIDPNGMALDEQVQRVLHAWKSPMPRLLIFDNCEDPAILEQWKPTVGGCRVLVTSRSDEWPTLTQIRLGLLSPAESRALLQQLCARLTDTEADAIAEDLGHLPLALHLAGSYLATYPHHMVDQYRMDLTIAHRSLKGRGALPSPTRHEQDIEATFMLSFNRLDPNDTLDALALAMLDGAAWCAHGVSIPRDLVLAFVPDGTDADDAVDALRRLQQLGLLDGVDAVVLHRLLAQVVQMRLGSMDMLAVVEDQIGAASSHANGTGVHRSMLPIESHLHHVTMRALDRGDALAASLANSLGYFEQLRGAYSAAQALFEQALAVREAVLGLEHPDTTFTMNNLATVLFHKGLYGEAAQLHEYVLGINTKILGLNHPDTALNMNNVALVWERQGRYREAQAMFEQSLIIREKILGITHPDTIQSLHNIAALWEHQGRYADAQFAYEQIVSVRKRHFGTEHPATIRVLNNLGVVLGKQGNYLDAQQACEQVVDLACKVLGAEHPETATFLNNLAFIFDGQERYHEAQACYERVLAIYIRTLGKSHLNTAICLQNLASTLTQQERYDEARSFHEQALEIKEQILGQSHIATALSMNNLADVLQCQGQYSEAQRLYQQALATCVHVLGKDHSDTVIVQRNLDLLIARMRLTE